MTTNSMTHTADAEYLFDYASGAASPAESLLLATHCAMAPRAARDLSLVQMTGGALLEQAEPETMAPDAFDRLMDRLENGPREAEPQESLGQSGTVPAPLARLIGQDYDALSWRHVGGGVRTFDLPVDDHTGRRAFLIRVPGSRTIPMHTHAGQEMVLVLQGGLSDEHGHFGPGELEVSDGTIVHQPIADAGQDCICLAVTDAPVKLTGPVGRLLNLFVRI